MPDSEYPVETPSDPQIENLRVPPHSAEAEASVLGGLLLDNNAFDRVEGVVGENDFYRYEHRIIYASLKRLIAANKPADAVTVHEDLERQGKAQEAGGLPYLATLVQQVPSASNIRQYADIVRERSILRQLVSVSDEIATRAFNPKGRPVSQILDDAESMIFKIGEESARLK
ncbi:MAG: replicative DNA helicase, partial [Rhodocyclaceae bacterium]|nr:replicative DNA helicase [Rhodocyclaceae bacterium]